MSNNTPFVSPFKWAGGKRWLARNYAALLPTEFGTYYEPFLGGGSIFFNLEPKQAVLSDLNEDLISTYLAIKQDWEAVERLLRVHQKKHSKEYYYNTRSKRPEDVIHRAAWFLYMNRACYNGLYRVNLNGVFNVPKGTKDKILLDTDRFEEVSKLLKKAKILVSDFEDAVDNAQKGDFVYADPPYTVQHNNNGFIKYNENLFTWADQERLASAASRAAKRGVKVAISNANHASLVDLYAEFGEIFELERGSTIGGAKAKRGRTTEVLIICGH